MFDARKFTDELKPPAFTDLDGETHIGRHLSFEQTLEWSERLATVAYDPNQPADQKKQEITALAAAFGFPPAKLLALPRPALIAAFMDFFASPGPEAPPTPS